jgi:hypothetical protein
MAFVPGFQYDLFITYASNDDNGRLTQFVHDFSAHLTGDLGKLFTERSIFFDRQDLNRTPLDWKAKLKQSAGSAALLVPILSSSYATSEYCAVELEWFCEAGDHPLRWLAGTEEVYRICPIRWRPLDEATHQELAPEIKVAQEQRSISVAELSATIANGLRLMRRSCQTVFVGETEHEVRRNVWNELSRMGFRVMPDVPGAFRDEARVRKHLGEARLAVHFVGGQAQQRAIDAIQWSRHDCRGATVVYEIPSCDITDGERISLDWIAEDIRQAPAGDPRVYDRIGEKNLDQFLQALRDRLEAVRPVPATRLGIACEETDRAAVEAIVPEIRLRTGFTVTCHGLSLLDFKKSRGLLFYWGAAEGKRLRQARLVTRGSSDAFFLAPPPKPDGYEQELGGGLVFRQQGDRFRVDDIGPFLRQLGWAG